MHRRAPPHLGTPFDAAREMPPEAPDYLQIRPYSILTPLGALQLRMTQRGVRALEFLPPNTRDDISHQTSLTVSLDRPPEPEDSETIATVLDAITNCMCEPHRTPSSTSPLPLDQTGTPFQLAVWRYLQNIPLGSVRTYAQVASAIGRPHAIRAVASACAKNQIALIVPCHRVIRSDGTMGEYRWGKHRKELLLSRERAFTVLPL